MLSATPIAFDAANSTLVIQGTDAADDAIVWTDAGGRFYARMITDGNTFTASFAPSTVALVKFYGEAGDDRFQNTTSVPSMAWGGLGNDTLIGGAGNDVFYGGSGNDVLFGNNGEDRLYGEAGDDLILGGNGDDRLEGGAGKDRIFGGAGRDVLVGGDGDDELFGEAGHDILVGDAGNDRLNGGIGNDYLSGGAGHDVLLGGDGNDTLSGDSGNDQLEGHAGNDVLRGGSGNDRLFGGDGDDLLYGDTGDDELRGELGNDILFGGPGNDMLFGDAGHDVLVGGEDNDTVTGGNGHDVLIGGQGLDILYGFADDDVLIGGTTAYDSDFAKLRALMLAWSAKTPYAARVQRIQDGSFEAYLSSTKTVFDDGVADRLFGGDGQDWFIQTGSVGTYLPAHSHDDSSSEGELDHHHAQDVLDHPPALEGFQLASALDHLEDRKADEAIHSRLPHPEDPMLQREHLLLFELVRYDQVTHYATRSGDWSDPNTWHNGAAPSAGARVLIPLGIEVQVDSMLATRLATVRVDGTLSFATTRTTELKADTVVVSGTGAFIMGTAQAPIARGFRARLLITNDGPIDRVRDPFAQGRGLISHGRVSIHGAAIGSSAVLALPPQAGMDVLQLNQLPIGWRVGDIVVIAATVAGTEQNELRTIRHISGTTVGLTQPLNFSHAPARSDFDVHVANLTRNAVIESEASATDRRGHVMFMHNRNVDIAYAGFYRLGRTDKLTIVNDAAVDDQWKLLEGTGTNQRGRYVVHFHRTGANRNGNPAVLRGSAVMDSPSWGFVNHSSYVDMIDNVAYDVSGAAFSSEAGDEIGSFRGNLAIGTKGSGETIDARLSRQDFGHQGDGFWFQGGGVFVTDNVAAGNRGAAFNYYMRGLWESDGQRMFLASNLLDPTAANGAPLIDVSEMPLFEFANNVAYASSTGLAVRYHFLMSLAPTSASLLRDSTFWNNTTGIDLSYARRLTLENLAVEHSGPRPAVGVTANPLTRNITYRNLTVKGYRWGIEVPRAGSSIIDGGRFNNLTDVVIQTANAPNRSVLITGLVQFEGSLHVQMRPRIDHAAHQIHAVFASDTVTLNYGPYTNQRLYYLSQHADAVPFPEPWLGVPSNYIGLTNQQLWDRFGVALAGEVAPSDAIEVPIFTGLLR